MISSQIGQIVLVVYGVLLGVGGYIGFRKAGSRASLRAGVISGIAALGAAGVANSRPDLGYWVGALLATMMLIVFGIRFAKTRKFMPSGMLGVLSLVVLAVMLLVDKGR